MLEVFMMWIIVRLVEYIYEGKITFVSVFARLLVGLVISASLSTPNLFPCKTVPSWFFYL